MNDNFIANRLSELRLAKGVSAREMSLAIGQNENYVNRIENGTGVSTDGLSYICEYLGITMSEFFDEGNSVPEHHRKLYADIRRLSPSQTKLISDLVAELANNKQ